MAFAGQKRGPRMRNGLITRLKTKKKKKSNEECLYNVDSICCRPHLKSNIEATVSIFNIYFEASTWINFW